MKKSTRVICGLIALLLALGFIGVLIASIALT